ncbi:MAG: hypothetical protein LUD72_09455 [Bacteroidales bacterium]|nr:hypothetical protein [Bacteroidales bacterium]
MALELVTGYRGVLHITAPQDADLYRGLIGDGRLTVGNGLSVKKTGNTEVTVMDGVCVLDGREFFIGYEDSEIFSTEDMSGTMYLVITYEKDEDRHETARLELVESYADVDIRTLPDMSQKLLATLEISDEGIVESVTEEIPVADSILETISEAAAVISMAEDAAKKASEAVEGLDELKEETETVKSDTEVAKERANEAAEAAKEAAESANTAAQSVYTDKDFFLLLNDDHTLTLCHNEEDADKVNSKIEQI